MKKKYLVIGGCGFIGSHLVKKLVSKNEDVVVVDNLSAGKIEFLKYYSSKPNLEIIQCDILNHKDLNEAFKRSNPDTVIHLAAIHHIPTCDQNPVLTLRTNIEGVQNVLNECAKSEVKRLIFTSTGAIYSETNAPLNELSAIDPQNIYGLSKKCAEDLIKIFSKRTKCASIIVRLFNTVGTNETNKHLIPDILEQIWKGKTTIRLGNLSPRRDYIHVLDVVDAIYLLSKVKIQGNFEIVNVGSGKEYSVEDVVNLLSKILSRKIIANSDPDLKRRFDRKSQLADINKIQRLITWKPIRSLEEAFKEILDQYNKGFRLGKA
ncbi:MAG: NAD(P)-dependent oxidoreductase [Bacteroidota bacterium]